MTGFYIKERTAVRSEGLAAVDGFEPPFARRVLATAKSVNAEKAEKADKRGKNET